MTNLPIYNRKSISPPSPIFDALEYIDWSVTAFPYECSNLPIFAANEFKYARDFLYSYKDNLQTFNAYRREIERFLAWCWFYTNQSLLEVRREQFEEYIKFCTAPPISWIGFKKVPRFVLDSHHLGLRIPNPKWRPFVVTLPKYLHHQDVELDRSSYVLSQKSLQEIFAIMSSFLQLHDPRRNNWD